MTKSKIDQGVIDILSKALFMGTISEAEASYLAVEYVKMERYKMDNEYTLLERFIVNQGETLAFDPSYLQVEAFTNSLNAALTLLKTFNRKCVQGGIRIESLLEDGDFNAVMNSVYYLSLDSDNNLSVSDELLKDIFRESELDEVKEIVTKVHKIRTPEKQMEYLNEEI